MFKKIITVLLALLLCFTFIGCGRGKAPDNVPDDVNDGEQEIPPPEDGKEGTVDELVQNFWQTETMTDETVLFIAQTDEAGNVVSAPVATTMFKPKEILQIKQYFHENNGGKVVEFTQTDYSFYNGVITAKGELAENPITGLKEYSTTVPYVTDKQLTGEQAFPGLNLISDIPSTDSGLYLPFTESYQIVQMQVSITYTHDLTYTGALPEFKGETLSKTLAKLENKQDVELFVYGDSISTGANASSVLGIEPYLPSFPQLFATNLGRYYGCNVNLTNKSVGGWTSANGVGGGTGFVGGKQINQVGLADMLSGELSGYSPDIAVIGFGMNDATMGSPNINSYLRNIMSMIDTLRAVNPDCEIILLGTMLANPKALNQSKNQTEYTANLSKIMLQSAYSTGICVVDVGAIHQSILDMGKQYTEFTSNNVNHPNDFMTRVYAMALLSALIDTDEEVTGNAVIENFKKRGYGLLFADPYFTCGIAVTTADNAKADSIVFPDGPNEAPAWNFAQWFTKYDISEYKSRKYENGGNSVTYTSKGITDNGTFIPAKVLTVDREKATVYMELNAQAEYDSPRVDGEGWPHTLLSQEFDAPLVHVPDCSELIMSMDYTVTKCEDKMGGQADSRLHCAQFVWYITLQNRTVGHPDYGKYVWYGLNLWDNRNEGKATAEWGAQDAGKEDATGAFIYHPASADYFKTGVCPSVGENVKIEFDVMQSAKRAYELAVQRGYLGDTAWEDIYVGGMNFGFENTGTYNTAVQINAVGVYYK